MKRLPQFPRFLVLLLAIVLVAPSSFAVTRVKRSSRIPQRSAVARAHNGAATKKSGKAAKTGTRASVRSGRASAKADVAVRGRNARLGARGKLRSVSLRRSAGPSLIAGGPWLEPTFADSTSGDKIDGEDLAVRRAAVEALGALNGSVVVADPTTGRILTIVNQKVAFSNGYQPCSTVKVYAALAGLSEGIIDSNTQQRIYGRAHMNLTTALAKSNNPFFANIGIQLGYDKVSHYARMFGLGEKAGLNIPEEQPGAIVDGPPALGGMGMMTSFGEGIKLTPLQLLSLMSALANNGTMNYLQYPKTQAEAQSLVPKMKRQLPIEKLIPELTPGMLGATEFGTARRAGYSYNEPIFGKTGTCTDRESPVHLGWFGSFSEVNGRKYAVVVLLTGGRYISGPAASGVAGQIYRALAEQKNTAVSTL